MEGKTAKLTTASRLGFLTRIINEGVTGKTIFNILIIDHMPQTKRL